MNMDEFLVKAREWQKQNTDWQLYCDMTKSEADALYLKLGELPKKERMSWVGTYGSEAVKAWEEFTTKICKVPVAYLNEAMNLCTRWPEGCAMLCFKTGRK
jgi:hypothetical protein